ncbi:MAG TPA: hypothetical protein DDX39_09780 [Bacteroidales bacterium]|nr:MAG: hypothetical protein A2W98_01595 [Bacteroidetes bacterium GWF2_33_38]OFY74015.1 MAG: hypothetical protein A2265_04340 [Bacteroidetes bacterium RIFOXYA12_FULL_33_9]OFY90673.1 MAG: hypothetical protein A2236_04210 [Bacteroidetes bacterium RIFOXYA2_FULL_33_7]HBF88918.1 hypothetical protein [Bacteroidales bacterium]
MILRIFQKFKFILASTIVFFVVFLAYFLFNIIATEGFNPSDDGVILAQSFRILNGEIPHKDFISIRPVFSGILHTIHFYSPLALEVSARWFVFFQYFIYSFVWVYLLFKNFVNNPSQKYFAILGSLAFLLNINFYNLFPWTTIDALFWFIIGLSFLVTSYKKSKKFSFTVFAGIGFFFMTLAVLSRQTFGIPFAIIWILYAYNLLKSKKIKQLIFSTLLGGIPFIFYFTILIITDSLSLFITQLTGRTELFETGILTYGKRFFQSPLIFIHLFALSGIFYHLYKNKFRLYVSIIKAQNRLFFSFLGIYFAAIIFYAFYAFFQDIWHLFDVSFEFFWIAFIASLYVLVFFRFHFSQKLIIISSILLAWTSSISLGDNAPIFTIGLLVSISIVIIYRFLLTIKTTVFEKISTNYIFTAILSCSIILFYFEIRNQQKINYRDKSANELTYNLGNIFKEFGSIRTSENTFNYYADLKRTINSLENPINNFVVIPNNAIIYPIMKSRNPFPCDWLQRDEYIGSEEYLNEKIINALNNRLLYIIVDKFDSKKLAYGSFAKEYNSNYYSYMNTLFPRLSKINADSKFFDVYKTH